MRFYEEEGLFPIIIETLILESKLTMLEGNLELDVELLRKAAVNAEEVGLTFLQRKANDEKRIMEKYFMDIRNFIEKNQKMCQQGSKN